MTGRVKAPSLTLNGRLVLATSLPLLVLTILLSTNSVFERQRDLTDRLHQMGSRISGSLATISDFALYSGNEKLLRSLANASSRVEDVSGVAFLNADREVLISTIEATGWRPEIIGKDHAGGPVSDGKFLYFLRPVVPAAVDIDDYDSAVSADSSAQPIGWVVVALDTTASLAERRMILINGVGISLGIMLMAFLLSYLLGRNIIAPIKDLTETVNKVEWGDFSVRAAVSPGLELGSLARGINHMIDAIEQSQLSLQHEVASATNQLQLTLADLRSKNSELKAARLLADEANAAKSEFLARMSHELRTPLTSIQGFIRLLAKADLELSEKQYCLIVDQAAEQLLRLIDDILEFTRLQAGATTLEALPFNLLHCLENPVRMQAPVAFDKGIELIVDVEPDVPLELVGDSLRIRQVVSNLVANAIKFTDSGYVRVYVSASAVTAEDCQLEIGVEDTGIGIRSEQRDKVFQAFTQADTSISRRFGGTGLGLSIVNNLAGLMGGEVSIQGEEERGTKVSVTLTLSRQKDFTPRSKLELAVVLYDPSALSRNAMAHLMSRAVEGCVSCGDIREFRQALTAMPVAAVVVSVSAIASVAEEMQAKLLAEIRSYTDAPIIMASPLSNLAGRIPSEQQDLLQPIIFTSKPASMEELYDILHTINDKTSTVPGQEKPLLGINALVAEDNEFSQLLLKTLLHKAGCHCYTVGNGREAIEACRLRMFEILLVDLHMPEVNGIVALEKIRSSTGLNQQTPAILLTADVLSHETEGAASAGANLVILKPFDETALISAIMDLTGRRAVQDISVDDIRQRVPRERFYSEIESLLDTARAAHRDEAIVQLREAIHQLVGIAGIYQLGSLEKQVRLLHSLVKSADYARVETAIEGIASEVESLKLASG